MVLVTPDADRTMNTFLGINERISKEDIVESALSSSTYLYIEGYLVAFPAGRAVAKEAKRLAEKHNVKTSLTFSDPSMTEYFKDGLLEVLGEGVDLLFCNEAEARIFSGANDVRVAADHLTKLAKSFVITLGPRGALVFDGKSFKNVEAFKTKAIDTTGAGDLFAGAYIYALTQGHSPAEAGRFACLAASKVVSRFGPRLNADEARELLHQWKHGKRET